MAKLMKKQLLTLSLITTLLFLTPLLSPSLRSTYLYFIINVLIIALGIEAGLLSSSSSSPPSKNPDGLGIQTPSNQTIVTSKPTNSLANSKSCGDDRHGEISNIDFTINPKVDVFDQQITNEKKVKLASSEKIVSCVKVIEMKKCPSTPTIFFIGNNEEKKVEEEEEKEEAEEFDDDEEEEVSEREEEELFAKAEIFIGNFYKQLKMQREESWNRINGFNYQNCYT